MLHYTILYCPCPAANTLSGRLGERGGRVRGQVSERRRFVPVAASPALAAAGPPPPLPLLPPRLRRRRRVAAAAPRPGGRGEWWRGEGKDGREGGRVRASQGNRYDSIHRSVSFGPQNQIIMQCTCKGKGRDAVSSCIDIGAHGLSI
jgi:hypothetical protein